MPANHRHQGNVVGEVKNVSYIIIGFVNGENPLKFKKEWEGTVSTFSNL